MPNYYYNSSDHMRYRNNGRQNCYPPQTPPPSVCPPQDTCPPPAVRPMPRMVQNAANCDKSMNMVLAMAYVPWQEWGDLYDADKGFHSGTIFCELNKPFCGAGGNVR